MAISSRRANFKARSVGVWAQRSLIIFVVFYAVVSCSGLDTDPEDLNADDLCRSHSDAQPTSRALNLAFVFTSSRDTTLIDTALRSLLYFRTCAVHLHLVVDEATADIDWDWLSWYPNVQHSVYVTTFDPKAALRSSTYEKWGTGTTPDGESYAWPREVMPSRFAKLSLDTIITGDVENLLFVDNDVVFLDDVCKAHDVFDSMSDKSLFGMATQMSDLYTHVQAPFAFPVEASKRWRDQPGVNSGVVFWKLKRAHDNCWSRSAEDCRSSAIASKDSQTSAPQQHWLQHLEEAMDNHNLGLLDQDVFNYVAWRYPELLEVVPLKWNVQLVRHICTPNDADAESNLADNVNADIMILHGNARHFKMDVWFSRHVWFLFAHPTVTQYWDATRHHQRSTAICAARSAVQDAVKDYLSHCSWLA